jgi:hypothetical protein
LVNGLALEAVLFGFFEYAIDVGHNDGCARRVIRLDKQALQYQNGWRDS